MQRYKNYFTNKKYLLFLSEAFVWLGLSLVVQFFVSAYVNGLPSTPVADLILSNVPVQDVDGIFVWGSVALFFICILVGIQKINGLPFALKSVAVFTLIRSAFVVLTHISAFPTHIIINSVFFNKEVFNGIFSGNDLFFSGHTGLPFLLSLMFWNNKPFRYLFMFFSGMFAIVVLLGHIHYSIDVLSAFFITYSIFHICKWMFASEWAMFNEKV